jgi:Tol biopolymer transport system component
VRFNQNHSNALGFLDDQYTVLRSATENLSPQNRGQRLFAIGDGTFGQTDGFSGIDNMRVFRTSPAPGSDQVLFSERSDFNTDIIYLTNLNNPGNLIELRDTQSNCTVSGPDCNVNDIQWMPDGNSFIYSINIIPEFSDGPVIGTQLRQYSESNGVANDQLLTELTDVELGRFSIAPNGQRLVIEVQGDQVGITDLYIYDIAGNSFNLLVENAASPAWSPF